MKANALMMRRIIGEAGRNGLTSGQPKVLEFLSTAGEAAMEIFRRADHAAASELSEQDPDILKKSLEQDSKLPYGRYEERQIEQRRSEGF